MNARLDVSFLLEDPDFVQTVTVIRRTESVNGHGRKEAAETEIPDVVAVVIPVDTAIGGNTIELDPDEQHRNSNLTVITKFRLRSLSRVDDVNYQADLVLWQGDRFKVVLINDYSAYGEGFIRADLAAINAVDEAPPEAEE